MTCISLSNNEKINLFTGYLNDPQCLFSAFLQAENAYLCSLVNRSCAFYGHNEITKKYKE